MTIRRKGSQYVVQSKTGKNLGKFSTRKAAENRLRQVEFFKYKNIKRK